MHSFPVISPVQRFSSHVSIEADLLSKYAHKQRKVCNFTVLGGLQLFSPANVDATETAAYEDLDGLAATMLAANEPLEMRILNDPD